MVLNRADECRQRADECRRGAAQAADEVLRVIWPRKHGDRQRQLEAQKNNQDSPDGKLENADWVVKKTETKDLGESQPATRIVWTITGRRKDPQAERTIVISCPTKLEGKAYKPSHYLRW
jgi:hypothetical protein